MSFMGAPGACFMVGHSRVGGPAGYVPSLDLTFTGNYAWSAAGVTTAASLLTTTRASNGYASNAAGVYSLFSSNVPRITDLGLLVEESRTNVVTYARDMTNAAWVKTNVSALKDQTGVDGVANSASSITASAGNGTILNTTTIASSARFQTAFVKRLVGSGTVQMTMDNGSTWTAVSVTADWTRVSIPTQTLANPVVGFRIVTSGDSVAVDFVQNENSGTFATSPIDTTSAAATRAADNIRLTTPSSVVVNAPGSLFADWTEVAGPVGVAGLVFQARVDASNNIDIRRSSANKIQAMAIAGGVSVAALSSTASVVAGTTYRAAFAYDTNDFAATSSIEAGVLTDATGALPTGIPTSAGIGNGSGSSQINGYVRRFAYFPTRLANAQLQALVA